MSCKTQDPQESVLPLVSVLAPGVMPSGRHSVAGLAALGQSTRDYLTGLTSRQHFELALKQAFEGIAAGRVANACVFFLDLDRFKRVNDTLGHAVGDELLRLVSDRLRGELDEGSVLARLGGDEFAILLMPAPDREAIGQLAKRLIDLVQRTYLIDGHVVHVGTSIGIAFAPSDGATSRELLRRADLALYESKHRGRGAFHFYRPEFELRALNKTALEADLRKAIVLRQFAMFYQPQVKVETGEITGFEAQLRWRHPARGLLVGEDFLDLGNEIGMTEAIGEWVLKTVCAEAKKWTDRFRFSFNVSAQEFENADFSLMVLRALVKSGVSGKRLEIQVTEDVLLRNNPAVPATLDALRELGIVVTLADFGTGVASLSQLAKLPFDKIKIDRSLLGSEPKHRAIIRAISAFGQSLGMQTQADGVESIDHLAEVRSDGCQTIEGFSANEAVPSEELNMLVQRLNDETSRGEK